MRIRIPLRLKGGLNAREHHMARHRRVEAEYEAVAWGFKTRDAKASLEIAKGCNPDGRWVVTLTRIAPRKLDRHDNLPGRFKSVADQVAKTLGIDDREERLSFRYAQARGAVREYAVEIEVQSERAWKQAEADRLLRELAESKA